LDGLYTSKKEGDKLLYLLDIYLIYNYSSNRNIYISFRYIFDIMKDLLHIRVGKKIKDQMQRLIDDGLFSNQAEIAREGIRNLLLKYSSEIKGKEK